MEMPLFKVKKSELAVATLQHQFCRQHWRALPALVTLAQLSTAGDPRPNPVSHVDAAGGSGCGGGPTRKKTPSVFREVSLQRLYLFSLATYEEDCLCCLHCLSAEQGGKADRGCPGICKRGPRSGKARSASKR